MKGFLYGKTEYNILASATRLDDYIRYAKNNNFDYLSITDSNMHGAYKFYKACKDNNIKPIIGLEYTYTIDLRKSKVLLYAKNNEGFKALLKITTEVKLNNTDTLDYLKDYKDNLVSVFVFNDSYLDDLLYSADFESLNLVLDKIKDMNGYIGVSYTNKISKLNDNKKMEEYANNYGIKALEIHELKYLNSEDYDVYQVLRKIDGYDEVINEFDDYSFLSNPPVSSELDNVINSINLDLFNGGVKLPKFPNTKNVDSETYLKALCHKGLEKRGKLFSNYVDRLKYELSVISKMGYNDYFLIVWDFIRYSKQNGILVGPGRGSAAGSLVAYTLGITDVDPLEYDLLFERFLNPERVSMPDIDTDFPDVDRDRVISYVKDLYGKDHVCSISTFGRFQLKSSINDLSRVTKIDQNRISKLAAMVEEYGFDKLIEEYKERDIELSKFLSIAKRLEKLPRNISTHAAGVILSSDELSDVIPLSEGSNDLLQSQFEASDLEAIGLLKMDFLALNNLTMLSGMMKDCNMKRADLYKLPHNDPKVFNLLQRGDTLGIFQLEKSGFRRVLIDLKPTCFNDLVAVLALYRPGPMDNIPEFIRCKHGGAIHYIHPDLEPILKDTYGVIVYQEQIMQIARKFAGFSLGEADLLRRAVSKKNASKLISLKEDFINRSINNGYKKELALEIYNLIYKFADYGFNKSHTVVYAELSYQIAWFKANRFPEFMANILNYSISSKDTMISYINYAKSHGLIIRKPDINISSTKFVKANNALYMPLSSIYSLGKIIPEKILEEREKGIFLDINDLLNRCSFLNKATLEALIYSGALDSFDRTKKSLISEIEKDIGGFSEFINMVEVKDEYDFDYLADNEKKYLGINLEYNIFSNNNELRKRFKANSINDLRYNEPNQIICAFRNVKEVKTKKNNESMLSFEVYDEALSLRGVMFHKDYEKLGIIPNSNELYLLRGTLKKDNRNEDSFQVREIIKI